MPLTVVWGMFSLQYGALLLTKWLYQFWYFWYIYNKKYNWKWSSCQFSEIKEHKHKSYIKMFCIQIQRASQTGAGVSAGHVYSAVTEFRRRPDNCVPEQRRSVTKLPARSTSTWRHRKAQTGTCRGAPSGSDTASEPEDAVSTKSHTWGERSVSVCPDEQSKPSKAFKTHADLRGPREPAVNTGALFILVCFFLR